MSSAGVAARPRALRLDELPAEVPAYEQPPPRTVGEKDAVHVSTPASPCRSCRRARPSSSSSLPTCAGAGHRPSRCGWCAGAHCTLTSERALEWLDEPSWSRAPSDRRFKEALKAPFWTTLRPGITGTLWRALERPGALLRRSCPSVCAVQCGTALCALCTDTPRPLQARPQARAPGGGSRSRAAP